MRKVYVLDTNVLLHDPNAMLGFIGQDVVLPITIVEELDRFKKQPEMTGRNARQASRMLDQLHQQGHLTSGIPLEHGGTLRVALCDRTTLKELPAELEGDRGDNEILAVALELKGKCDCPVVLVSKDTNLRIKADVLGLDVQDFQPEKVDVAELYTGTAEVLVEASTIETLFQQGEVVLDGKFFPNQAITLVDVVNPSHTALAMMDGQGKFARVLTKLPASGVSRISPRNREQSFALNLLLRDDVALVTLVGKAGTGKTLLAIAAGLQKVADERLYSRLLISRPVVPMGKDIGYLPGDVGEKLTPWMQPLYDNFDLIFGSVPEHRSRPEHGKSEHGKSDYTKSDFSKSDHSRFDRWRRGHEELIAQGLLQIEPLTYIRGRTLPQQFFVVDEAQNLTPHEVKTILTRAGEGTKVILTGDLDQIDNPYVDAASNGLTYVVERFKGDPLSGHITLVKGERSDLAERATQLL
jgi:PhoH-like ATPase